MPCACQIPVPNYPENVEWGPLVWTILHGFAQSPNVGIFPGDELREWSRLIKLTADMLPCDKCREHLTDFMRRRPIALFSQSPQLKHTVRSWLWDLHNEVNVKNDKPIYPFEELSVYSNINIQDLLWRLDPVIKKAIQINGLGFIKYTKWIGSVKMMRAILGL